MKKYDLIIQEDIQKYEGRHDDLIYQAPAFYRLLVSMLDDPTLPRKFRPLLLAGIAYFILPVDVISEDLEGPYGYVDDIFLCAYIADHIRKRIGSDEIITSNWNGEAPIIPLIEEIISREKELLEEKSKQLLDYIGFEFLVRE